MAQDDIRASGSAIEVRVYAEDADNGFLPQAGRAELVRWPQRARVDAALETGQEVSTFYDPMLAKIITHAPTREGARRALLDALDDTAVFGLTTNLGFLRRLVASEPFATAGIDTAWLDRSPAGLHRETPEVALVAAGWVLAAHRPDVDPRHPFALGDGWRLAGPPAPSSSSSNIKARRWWSAWMWPPARSRPGTPGACVRWRAPAAEFAS